MDAQTFQRETLRIERLLYHVAYTALGDSGECADYVQEALLRAWKNRARLKDEGAFKSWMVRILMNVITDDKRKKRPDALPPDWDEPIQIADNLPLREALMLLPRDMRFCVTLVYLDGCTMREAADMLNVPEGTVKSRLSRARTLLKNYLTEEA